jgi:hypothetical protein
MGIRLAQGDGLQPHEDHQCLRPPELVAEYLSELAQERGKADSRGRDLIRVAGADRHHAGRHRRGGRSLLLVQPWNMVASDGG